MKNVAPQFTSSEENFVIVNGMMCHSCLTNIKSFSNLKKSYTTSYVQAIIDKCTEVDAIPNLVQRQKTSVSLRAILSDAGALCCTNMLTLYSYIESGFPEVKWSMMKKLAGGAYYEEARKENWVSASTMNGMMLTFIKTYNADLTKGDMPDTFPEKCTADSNSYDTAFSTYENNKGIAEQQAASRTSGFNDVYTSLKGIMKDGKLIYSDDIATRKQFTYDSILKKITKNKRSGFRIAVTDSVSELPVTTASVEFVQGEWLFKANKKGIIYATVPEGDYTGTISAPGYKSVTLNLTSNKGIVHREDVSLVAIAVKALAELV